MADFDPRELRAALGSYMTGVTVVTALTERGEPVGFTANSFTSVSLNPPLLLVCPGNHLSSFDVFAKAQNFAVNILAEGQETISNTFASSADDRFSKVSWRADSNGCPLIDGAAAQFSCAVHQAVEAGDHMILIGRILSFETTGQAGLGYCRDGYFSLNQERDSEAPAARNIQTIAAALVEHQGRLCVLKSAEGYHLPRVKAADRSGARTAMTRHLSDLQITAELGPVYSVFDDAENASHVTVFRARLEELPAIDGIEWWPISEPGLSRLLPPANPQMMRRYQHEYRNNQFGLYIGDAVRGEVHHPVSTTA